MSGRPHRAARDASDSGLTTGQTPAGIHPGPANGTTGCPSAPVREYTRSYR